MDVPRNTCSIGRADHAGLLVDASDYYVAFYRAALEARRYMLMSGWQFDSTVELLRGDDVALAAAAGGKTRLLDFLNHLCATRPELEIYVLAWDFHVVLTFEREWMQKIVFNWTTNERLRFRFDSSHPPMGSHHQKFVVVDGAMSFVGGIDLCEARWDDRAHKQDNPRRLSRGAKQKPYHDVQAYLHGREAAAPLVRLFRERWLRACGGDLELPDVSGTAATQYEARGALKIPPGPLGYSRTDPLAGQERQCTREIAALHVDAIDAAEELIYLETQYFSSSDIRQALERRMRAADRPRLEIVLVVNERAEALKEELAVGLRQAENIGWLRRIAADTGHALGVYYSLCEGQPGERTYIHTKLTIIDDNFMTVGSANLTNRSLGVDTELNVTWETASHDAPAALGRAIRRVRVSLLAEHSGATGVATVAKLMRAKGLVARLDELAEAPEWRLQRHPSPTPREAQVLAVVDPQELPFDPRFPDEDQLKEELVADKALFRAGLAELVALFTAGRDEKKEEEHS